MEVRVEHEPIGRYVNLWFYDERYVYYFNSFDEGDTWVRQEELVEGVRPRPSLQISAQAWSAMIDAVRNDTHGSTVDGFTVEVLRREQDRVDRLIDVVVTRERPSP